MSNTIGSKFIARNPAAVATKRSAAPDMKTTPQSAPAADEVILSAPKEAESKGTSGRALASIGAAVGLGLVAMGAASPASAHGVCGWQTSSYTVSNGWHSDYVEEGFNTCTGQHVTAVNGNIVDNHYDNVGHGNWQRHNHGHHGHHGGHHDHDNDAEVGAAFLLGILGGIILNQ